MIATGTFGGPPSTIGRLGVSLAFGLSLLCAAYLFGHISGCHINPAVTVGMWALKRTEGREVPAYIVGQLIGAALAGLTLFGIFESSDTVAKSKLGFAGHLLGSVERLRQPLAGRLRARRR